MKSFSAVALVLVVSTVASAQRRGAAPGQATISGPAASIRAAAPPIGVHSAGALGGSFASVGMSRPLGGIAPSTLSTQRHRPSSSFGRYIGPIYYVPNAYDTSYQSYGYSTFNTPANPALYYTPTLSQPSSQPPSTQPIIINQYFGSRDAGTTTTTSETTNPGDPIGPPQNYYLIAYKNHSVYSALAYWLEGETLHYVTTQNTHNQASLSLIDLDQTTKLNADNAVPFSLTGK